MRERVTPAPSPRRQIAPKQLRLACRRGTYFATDCGQTSRGTTINERKLGPNEAVELCHGDSVLVGLSLYRFLIDG